jgi:hypothetical protein
MRVPTGPTCRFTQCPQTFPSPHSIPALTSSSREHSPGGTNNTQRLQSWPSDTGTDPEESSSVPFHPHYTNQFPPKPMLPAVLIIKIPPPNGPTVIPYNPTQQVLYPNPKHPKPFKNFFSNSKKHSPFTTTDIYPIPMVSNHCSIHRRPQSPSLQRSSDSNPPPPNLRNPQNTSPKSKPLQIPQFQHLRKSPPSKVQLKLFNIRTCAALRSTVLKSSMY